MYLIIKHCDSAQQPDSIKRHLGKIDTFPPPPSKSLSTIWKTKQVEGSLSAVKSQPSGVQLYTMCNGQKVLGTIAVELKANFSAMTSHFRGLNLVGLQLEASQRSLLFRKQGTHAYWKSGVGKLLEQQAGCLQPTAPATDPLLL